MNYISSSISFIDLIDSNNTIFLFKYSLEGVEMWRLNDDASVIRNATTCGGFRGFRGWTTKPRANLVEVLNC